MSSALYDLPGWLQKLLALGILFALLFVPFFWASQMLNGYTSNEELIVEKRQQLWRFESFANYVLEQPTEEATLKTDELETVDKEFLGTNLEPVMMAQLQTRLKDIAKIHGAKIIAIGGIPEVTDDNVRYVGLRMSASGTYKSIYGMLLDIETSKPYLFVRQAHLRSSISSIRDSSRDVEISAQLNVFGAVSKTPVNSAGSSQ